MSGLEVQCTVLAVLGFTLAAAGTSWGTGRLIGWLERRQVIDTPNARSSHTHPTPRGGGLAVVAVVVVGWGLLAASGRLVDQASAPLAGAALLGLLLAWLGWVDDRRTGGLSARVRLAGQTAIACLGTALLPGDALLLGGWVPFWLDRSIIVLGWVWMINLTNFMDGIDGISGAQTATVAGGVAVLALAGTGVAAGLAGPAAILAGAAVGFLRWNWQPARVFLGDVGSLALGFWMGWLLLEVALSGLRAAALILPAYYLADATVTLLARAARGEKVWEAHRSHFYQVASRGLASHAAVVRRILALNLALIVLAVCVATGAMGRIAGLGMAGVAVTALLLALHLNGKVVRPPGG